MSAAIIERAHLLDAATIERRTRVADGAGGWTESWSVVGVHPCNVQFRNGLSNNVRLDRRETLRDIAIIRFPPTADVRGDDRITVNSVRYRVINVRLKTRAWTLVAICMRWGDE